MAKRNNFKSLPLLGWCSANSDNRDNRFIQLGVSFFESEAVQNLTNSEFKLYILMVKIASTSREFSFPRSLYINYMAPATFQNAKDGLIKKGFIETVFSGKNTRENSRYRFSFVWKK